MEELNTLEQVLFNHFCNSKNIVKILSEFDRPMLKYSFKEVLNHNTEYNEDYFIPYINKDGNYNTYYISRNYKKIYKKLCEIFELNNNNGSVYGTFIEKNKQKLKDEFPNLNEYKILEKLSKSYSDLFMSCYPTPSEKSERNYYE